MLTGTALVFRGYRNLKNNEKVLRDGSRGMATITRRYWQPSMAALWWISGRAGRSCHYIDYVLVIGRKRYVSRRTVLSTQSWEAASVGGLVEIRYLPQDPRINCPASGRSAGLLATGVSMAVGTMLTALTLSYLAVGSAGVFFRPIESPVDSNWTADSAVVLSISRSSDPFVRLIEPDRRLVRVQIGELPGNHGKPHRGVLVLAPGQYPDLKRGDILPVLRGPDARAVAGLVSDLR